MTKSTIIDYRQKLEEVSVNNEDKESMHEENSVRYLRMNWIYTITECQVQIEESYVTKEAQ
jgi:hypothetical protein